MKKVSEIVENVKANKKGFIKKTLIVVGSALGLGLIYSAIKGKKCVHEDDAYYDEKLDEVMNDIAEQAE